MGYIENNLYLEREHMLAKRSLNAALAIATSLALGLGLGTTPLSVAVASAATSPTTESVDVSKLVVNTNGKKTEKTNLSKAAQHVSYIVPLSEWVKDNGKKCSYSKREVSLKSDAYGANSSAINWIDFDNDKAYVEVWGSGEHEIVIRETFYNKKGKALHYIDHTFTARLRITSLSESNVVLTPFSKKNESIATAKLELKHATGDVTWSSSKPSIATVTDDGTVVAAKKGICKIKATAISSLTKKPVTVSCNVDVVSPKAHTAVAEAIKDYKTGTLLYSQSNRMKKGYRDCSSFVGRVYAKANVKLGSSSWSLTWSPPAADEAKYLQSKGRTVATKAVSTSKLRAGDLIFYSNTKDLDSIYHVAIYMGGGRVMHASDYNPGNCVRYRYSIIPSESKKALEKDEKIVYIGRPCK